ncbi:TPA: hypothetical protein RNS99_000727 [Stenotrophomonas maltophilia]|uniref:hypothetical protein n=1 Tax=Stenotrophomonas maltophilia TaxID=40324 RepID=UPI00066CB321|nr:hypothetical protein [Stenotrophomonas maltophilia]MBH1830476.1 hypothetical protein [Stenotrophomonas maltophilia]MDH2061303.1 hypothetical protein [Stenotrophomonas maltophilia]HDX0898475.1 hypothetical protein [Stenotrophomonas maltophilia]HDX0916507.1 hypothetical protein [Stenotrophomonas maltophilia]HEL3010003.1 hypothetical protein [Stenotrophomonas maltophilia]
MSAAQVVDAMENADRLYADYMKLSQLGTLGFLGTAEPHRSEIIASASPVLNEGYQNAVLG